MTADRPLTALGLMSGTSADGIDGVLVRLTAKPTLAQVQAAYHHHVPYTAAQRRAVLEVFSPEKATAEAVCRLNFAMGEWFASAALDTLRAAAASPEAVDVIGSHGQTVLHLPPGTGTPGSTLQIGEPAVIAERTGVTTVGDFRVRDVAAGGHGAPLVSYVDSLLFRHPERPRAMLNLGGIANVTLLPPLGGAGAPVACDTGPANMVLDWLAERITEGAAAFDAGGRLAAAGRVHGGLLEEVIAGDAYFAAPAPKTTGRERYGAPYAERLWHRAAALGLAPESLMATATALTAETVGATIRRAWGSGARHGEVIAGGGGTRNPTLMAAIAGRLGGATLTTNEAYGVDSQAKEALSSAILAAAAVRGVANTVPSCTGAARPVVMGKILPGRGFGPLMRRLHGHAGVGEAAAG